MVGDPGEELVQWLAKINVAIGNIELAASLSPNSVAAGGAVDTQPNRPVTLQHLDRLRGLASKTEEVLSPLCDAATRRDWATEGPQQLEQILFEIGLRKYKGDGTRH